MNKLALINNDVDTLSSYKSIVADLKESSSIGSNSQSTPSKNGIFLFFMALSYLLLKLTGGGTDTGGGSSTTTVAPTNPINCYGSSCDECGKTYVAPNVKIVGGNFSAANSWPASIYLKIVVNRYVFAQNSTWFLVRQNYSCGGTLINRDTVLTASHCILTKLDYIYNNSKYSLPISVDPSMYIVYLGFYNLTNEQTEPGVIKPVKKVIMHPNYSSETALNDIAILKLASPVDLTRTIQIACLPDESMGDYPSEYNQSVWAMGWGTTISGAQVISNVQKNVVLTLYEPSKCAKILPARPKDWSAQLCIGYTPGGRDTCQGDSGGGVYMKRDNNSYIAVGVVSYGDGCGKVNNSGIYTKISHYLTWIKQTLLSN